MTESPRDLLLGPDSPEPKKKFWVKGRPRRQLVLGFIFSVLVFSLSVFVRDVKAIRSQPLTSWTEDASADCAVVLTGGPNRVREGFDLLARGAVQKLILSGVHPGAELREIFPLWPYYGDLKEQDVILERRSLTTYGNAQQTHALVEALHCRDLILVTSRVHMYRAMKMFRAEFPSEYPLLARSVQTGSVEPEWDEVAVEAIKSLFYGLWAY